MCPMNKYYVVYKTYKTKKRTHDCLKSYLDRENLSKIDDNYITNLCGTITYASVFMMPTSKLNDGEKYTMSEICIHTQGIVSTELYNILCSLCHISTTNDVQVRVRELSNILSNYLFDEVFTWLDCNVSDVYAALAMCYAKLTNDVDLQKKCLIPDNLTAIRAHFYKFV